MYIMTLHVKMVSNIQNTVMLDLELVSKLDMSNRIWRHATQSMGPELYGVLKSLYWYAPATFINI